MPLITHARQFSLRYVCRLVVFRIPRFTALAKKEKTSSSSRFILSCSFGTPWPVEVERLGDVAGRGVGGAIGWAEAWGRLGCVWLEGGGQGCRGQERVGAGLVGGVLGGV